MNDHQHQWIAGRGIQDNTLTYACADCDHTTIGCSECTQPLATELTICDRCLNRARKIITDITHDIETVPFHHAEIMGLKAIRYDRILVASSGDVTRLPFGLDLITEDPEDCRISAAKHPDSAIDILVGWAEAWADTRTERVNYWATYLVDHTLWAAQNPDTSGWTTYLTEARQVRATVRRLLGLTPERQATPCVHCGGAVVQDWTTRGLEDTLRCTGCDMTWRDAAVLTYSNHITVMGLPETHPDSLVTLEDARRVFPDLKRNTLNQAVKRDRERSVDARRLPEMGKTVRGATLYKLSDIAQIWDAQGVA